MLYLENVAFLISSSSLSFSLSLCVYLDFPVSQWSTWV